MGRNNRSARAMAWCDVSAVIRRCQQAAAKYAGQDGSARLDVGESFARQRPAAAVVAGEWPSTGHIGRR